MSSRQVQLLVERYRQALSRLNRLTDRLNESQRQRYVKLKNRFEAQLDAWEKMKVSETNQVNANLQESYHEIESIWYRGKRSSQRTSA